MPQEGAEDLSLELSLSRGFRAEEMSPSGERGFSYLREKLLALKELLESMNLSPSPLASDGKLSILERAIRVVLSQNTNDNLALRAMNKLRELSPDLSSLAKVPLEEVERAVSVSGMRRAKARTIRALVENRVLLSSIGELPPDEALKKLTSIRGIGPKSARVILLFHYRMPFFPVDTHIFRIFRRLGWLGEPRTPEEVSRAVERSGLTAAEMYSLHKSLIRFGREICKARNPRCELCPLREECEHYQRQGVMSDGSERDKGVSR